MRTDWLLRCYPRAWRNRYEDEFRAMLEQMPASLRLHFDLLRGALDAHLHPSLIPAASPKAGDARRGRRKPQGTTLCLLILVLAFALVGAPQFRQQASHPRALFA